MAFSCSDFNRQREAFPDRRFRVKFEKHHIFFSTRIKNCQLAPLRTGCRRESSDGIGIKVHLTAVRNYCP